MRKLEALRQKMLDLVAELPEKSSYPGGPTDVSYIRDDLHKLRGRFMRVAPYDQQSWQYDWNESVTVTIEVRSSKMLSQTLDEALAATQSAVVYQGEVVMEGRYDRCISYLESRFADIDDLDLVYVKDNGELGRCASFVLFNESILT